MLFVLVYIKKVYFCVVKLQLTRIVPIDDDDDDDDDDEDEEEEDE